jgi:tripartite-type tricarboxylate transporter receptor subunit TctC
VESRATSTEQFTAFVKSEAAKWGKIIADAGIKEP